MRYRDFTLAGGRGTERAKRRDAAISWLSQKLRQNSGLTLVAELLHRNMPRKIANKICVKSLKYITIT
jgi:hypothetical protein